MAFDNLKEGIQSAIKNLRKAVVLDKKTIREYTKEIQKSLLRSDVNVNLVFDLTKKIEERALLEKPPGGLNRKENVVKITYDELVALVGTGKPMELSKAKILLVGVQGSGKTTTAAKLAYHYKKRGLGIGLICADTFRPGAYDQLKQLAQEIDVAFYGAKDGKNGLEIIKQGLEHFKGKDIIIIDSEGRHKLDRGLMEDINRISGAVKPEEVLLVLDATIGQQAGAQAAAFKDSCGVTGVILTKLDGSAKGGGALSACNATGAKIHFIGVGEHIGDFEVFDPSRFISKIIGFGDIEGLLEKAKEAGVDEKAAERMMSGEFDMNDLLSQIKQMGSMGSLDKVLDMMPGLGGKIPKNMLDVQEGKMKKYKFMIDSMTKKERASPEIIKGTRIERIARGSGVAPSEVRELMRFYDQTKKIVRGMGNKRNLARMMKKLGMSGGMGM